MGDHRSTKQLQDPVPAKFTDNLLECPMAESISAMMAKVIEDPDRRQLLKTVFESTDFRVGSAMSGSEIHESGA